MKERTYSLLTTGCLAIAIASAFLFDAAGAFKWIVGGVGILAAIVSGMLHLGFAKEPTETTEIAAKEPLKQVEIIENAEVNSPEQDMPWIGLTDHISKTWTLVSTNLRDEQAKGYSTKSSQIWSIVIDNLSMPTPMEQDIIFWTAKHSPKTPANDFADQVVHIVERLSSRENELEYEFVLSPKGDVTIKPLRRKVRRESERHSLEERQHSRIKGTTVH
jgi:hypothetical protein